MQRCVDVAKSRLFANSPAAGVARLLASNLERLPHPK